MAGKTTFIKNLFASYANDPDLKVNDASASTAARTFIESPEKLMTEVTVEDKKNLIKFHYRIQDTPGVLHLLPLKLSTSVSCYGPPLCFPPSLTLASAFRSALIVARPVLPSPSCYPLLQGGLGGEGRQVRLSALRLQCALRGWPLFRKCGDRCVCGRDAKHDGSSFVSCTPFRTPWVLRPSLAPCRDVLEGEVKFPPFLLACRGRVALPRISLSFRVGPLAARPE